MEINQEGGYQMRWISAIPFILSCSLLVLTFPTSAYIVSIDAPADVASGIPLVVTGTSTFPAGTPISIVLSQSNAAGSETARKTTFTDNKSSFAVTFDTQSLQPGTYKVEIRPDRSIENRIGSGSKLYSLVTITDRVQDIGITSPRVVMAGETMTIAGNIRNLKSDGLQIRVVGPQGILFGPEYVSLDRDLEKKISFFAIRVQADTPGNYYAEFFDGEQPVGSVLFTATTPFGTRNPTIPPVATHQAALPSPETTHAAMGPLTSFLGVGFVVLVISRGFRF